MADLRGLGGRLYRGETNFDLVGSKKRWYAASLVLLTICTASMLFRGFNFGIEFEGGASFQFPTSGKTVADARTAVADAGVEVVSAQKAGGNFLVKTPELKDTESTAVKKSVAKAFGIDQGDVTDQSVSSSWGSQITRKALRALVVFLIAVVAYISFRFEPKMAIAGIAALVHDLWLTAGVYSIVGFEVTPSTVIGLLTILGFSLYDTVVVFDKVEENTRGLLGTGRMTYSQAANLAVNQTFMRSINTSLIALLPVAGLLFVGAGVLGAGTLKDLALVLFVGLAAGAYSSLFLATPILVDLKERESAYKALRQRVTARQSGAPARGSRTPGAVATAAEPARRGTATSVLDRDEPGDDGEGAVNGELVAGAARSSAAAPRPGQRPGSVRRKGGRPGRPSGKRKR